MLDLSAAVLNPSGHGQVFCSDLHFFEWTHALIRCKETVTGARGVFDYEQERGSFCYVDKDIVHGLERGIYAQPP